MIKVLDSGFYSTIQDLGRIGYRDFGVPVSGAMDAFSAGMANALLGNDPSDAVLELSLTGPKLRFEVPTVISITGAFMTPRLNKARIQNNHAIVIASGDVLSFGKLLQGCRSYIAVTGGFKTVEVMNSRSMYRNITETVVLNKNDELRIEEPKKALAEKFSGIKKNTVLFQKVELDTFKGPEFDRLSIEDQKRLSSEKFTISKYNDRMGYQLEEPLENNLESILTAPVLPGTVQLTPSGKLIILMRDGQTTGGYPRVLQLKEASINVLAQKRADDSIRFRF